MADKDMPNQEQSRFDRSERLWGAEAQKLLREGHVVLLGASSTGCEILKNLILPGLGHFTIVDDQKITKRDLGNNFFLHQTDEGKSRAASAVDVLNELNPLSSGKASEASIDSVINDAANYCAANKVSLVVASTELTLTQLKKLGAALEGKRVPIVSVSTSGMFGVIRIQADDQYVIHAMPGLDTVVHDLRPLRPWPELQAFYDRYNPQDEKLTVRDYAHLPWPLVINWAARAWRKDKGHPADYYPKNMKEWMELRPIILGWGRIYSKADAGEGDDENAEEHEAADAATKKPSLPGSFLDAKNNCSTALDIYSRNFPELKEILSHPRCAEPGKDDHEFWFLAHGLKKFRDNNGDMMPISGTIPDFTATTEMYRELQDLYKAKAEKDAAEIHKYASERQQAVGQAPMPFETAKVFSAHAWELCHITYPSFAKEHSPSDIFPLNLGEGSKWTQTDTEAFKWFVAHRAALLFRDKHGRHPGAAATAAEAKKPTDADVNELGELTKTILVDPARAGDFKPYLAEWTRGGGSEIVTIASILGATASQEAIKLIQNRRVPMSHTLLFNGMENFYTTIKCE